MGIAHESMSRGSLPAPERPSGLPDRYRVRRHIANGGMASVWCADDVLLGRSVAVKILAERFAHDQFAVLRFKREARAAARVSNHTHVVTVYDVGDLVPEPGVGRVGAGSPEGRAFIVMEYLAGGTVADAIHHDSVRRHEAMRWLREAASALDHAHERGIVHRDIKPANFLLDRARVLHVADFGIARLTTEDTITTTDQLFGTAAYLSPEQALGKEATGASDRYALAVAAFELLAGQRPFSAPHFSAQARQHIEEPPPAASELDRTLPRAVDEVLFAGLAKDAAARPESAGAFVAALQDALAGGSGAIRSEPRHRAPAAVADGARDRAPARPDPGAPGASTAAARRRTAAGTRPPVSRTPGPPPRERARRRRIVALGSIAAAVLVIVGIAVAATRGGGAHNDGSRVAARTPSAATHRTHTHARPARHHAATHPKTTTTTATTSSTTTTAAETSPAELESTGHQEMLAGDYSSAIPTLRQAVAAAAPDDPNHAYALYDLGRSLVLSGDPEEAIPILRQRLQIPDQQATVRAMLDTALAEAGQATTTGSGGAAPTSTTPTPPTQAPGSSGSPTQPGAPPAAPTGSGGAGLPGAGPNPGGDDRGSDGGGDDRGSGAKQNVRLRSGHRHGGGSIFRFITAVAG
jgi:tRNA A-37 threonylcarbamoyl transferase component Bud32